MYLLDGLNWILTFWRKIYPAHSWWKWNMKKNNNKNVTTINRNKEWCISYNKFNSPLTYAGWLPPSKHSQAIIEDFLRTFFIKLENQEKKNGKNTRKFFLEIFYAEICKILKKALFKTFLIREKRRWFQIFCQHSQYSWTFKGFPRLVVNTLLLLNLNELFLYYERR